MTPAPKKLGRPRIGAWRCYATMPDEITERIDAHRKLTGDTRNAVVIKLVERGLDASGVDSAWRAMDIYTALTFLNAVLRAEMSKATTVDAKRPIMRALAEVDGLMEYFKEERK